MKTQSVPSGGELTRGLAFQKGVYRVCRFIVGPFVKWLFPFRCAPCRVESPVFLALGNHTQNLDPALMVIGLRRHIRFVANASLTKGIAGFFLNNLFGLIPREKGAKGDAAVALIEANLKAGVSVGMFPEGNRSWDGETEFISRRTARLAKESGAGLVTYRFVGGYLLRPRWAAERRKGPMYGQLVREYTAQELSLMSEEEIYQAICRDLYVNAYAEQEARGDLYRGRRLAEGLEHAAYLCPICHRFGTIRTRRNEVSCACGLRATYAETGHFTGGNLPFSDFSQWNRFQKKWLQEHAAELRGRVSRPIVSDSGLKLTLVENGKSRVLSHDAAIAVFGDRVELAWDWSGETPFGQQGTDRRPEESSGKAGDGRGSGKERQLCPGQEGTFETKGPWKREEKTGKKGEERREGMRLVYPMDSITGFGTFLSRSIYFNCGSTRYQLVGKHTLPILEYYALWRALSGREYR